MFHFAQDFFRAWCGDAKVGDDRHQGIHRSLRARLRGHPRLQFTRLVRERIEVKGGGEPPKTALGMEESMIVQVIVDVGDEDRISHAPPEFLNVGLGRGSVHAQGVHDFGVGVFLGAGIDTEQRRGRHIHQASAIERAVKPANQRHGHPVAVYETRLGRGDAGGLGHRHRQHLALGDRTFVPHTRKFSNRQHAVVIDHGAFRAQAAERCAAAP